MSDDAPEIPDVFPVPGKFYLFACPWDWTFVGRFVRVHSLHHWMVCDSGYFTRTGATFEKLCADGFTPETQFHPTKGGGPRLIAVPNEVEEWLAPTPWVRKGGAK